MKSLLCHLAVAVIPFVALLGTIIILETLRRRRQLRALRSLRRVHARAMRGGR